MDVKDASLQVTRGRFDRTLVRSKTLLMSENRSCSEPARESEGRVLWVQLQTDLDSKKKNSFQKWNLGLSVYIRVGTQVYGVY